MVICRRKAVSILTFACELDQAANMSKARRNDTSMGRENGIQ